MNSNISHITPVSPAVINKIIARRNATVFVPPLTTEMQEVKSLTEQGRITTGILHRWDGTEPDRPCVFLQGFSHSEYTANNFMHQTFADDFRQVTGKFPKQILAVEEQDPGRSGTYVVFVA